MPFRYTEYTTKIHFMTSKRMPNLVYRACVKMGVSSNTRYIQVAVCEALSRDLGIPLEELLDELPAQRSTVLFDGTRRVKQIVPGSANTVEQVR
jgi:hypothetical protein